MKKNHTLWMLIGCALPVLLIFIFPLLGIKGNWPLFIFILLMFVCHLFMINWHKKRTHIEHNIEPKEKRNEHH